MLCCVSLHFSTLRYTHACKHTAQDFISGTVFRALLIRWHENVGNVDRIYSKLTNWTESEKVWRLKLLCSPIKLCDSCGRLGIHYDHMRDVLKTMCSHFKLQVTNWHYGCYFGWDCVFHQRTFFRSWTSKQVTRERGVNQNECVLNQVMCYNNRISQFVRPELCNRLLRIHYNQHVSGCLWCALNSHHNMKRTCYMCRYFWLKMC